MGSGKTKHLFVCRGCGYQAPKWLGRCPDCGSWNSLVEETEIETEGRPGGRRSSMGRPEPITSLSLESEMRYVAGIPEFDRTLGGGVVPGSVTLIGGEPGIGKSTLILQILAKLTEGGRSALYFSGEESAKQIGLRAERIGIRADRLFVLTGTCIDELLKQMEELKPALLAVDSIQTVYSQEMGAAPGSVGQVREAALRLMDLAKGSGIPVFLIGHVTKEGAIAGPKVLEHLVDTVLYFEGDRGHLYRILRAVKNRYGPCNEIGVFEMKDAGLCEVGNPSRIFLEERPENTSGSVVFPCLEGTRPLLVEIQALVGPSSFGTARRTASGMDQHRIALLVAVLEKRLGMQLAEQDIFVNIAGGLRVDEPAADLGLVSALMSSFLDRPVPQDWVFFGEVGLAGEVRGVNHPDLRIREARKLGFSRCCLSRSRLEGLQAVEGMQLTGVRSIQELFDALFG